MNIHHIVLTVTNMSRSKKFYSLFLGKPDHETKEFMSYEVGETTLFLGLPHKKGNKFNANAVGLNHVAFGVKSLKELKQLEGKLKKAKIKNSGVKINKYSQREYIWFDDPDGIRLEFFL
jgi:glyoxylase I family protein